MNRAIDPDDLMDAINKLREVKHNGYDATEELLHAGDFVAQFGTFDELFEGVDLERAQHWSGNPAAAWAQLGHWSIERGDPTTTGEPDESFDAHEALCRTCKYLEQVYGIRSMYEYEMCDECGLDLEDHDISPDPIGLAHAWCRTVKWTRGDPPVFYGGDSMGGDKQYGDATETRWWTRLSDGTYGMVIRYYYQAADEFDNDNEPIGEVYVERCDEYMWCTDYTDPGSTEINSEYVYTKLDDPATMDPRQLAIDSYEPEPGEWPSCAPEGARQLLVTRTPVAAA